jgi:hypothetical protein
MGRAAWWRVNSSVGQRYKKFYNRNLRMPVYDVKVVPGMPFQSSLMFMSMAGAYPRVELNKVTPLKNIGPGWKGIPGINTLAYNEHS